MGACNFGVRESGKDVNSAYRAACENAEDEYGHSNNGTISTTHGVRFFTKEETPRFGTKAYQKWENDIIEKETYGITKYGKAGAVEIPRSQMLKMYPYLKGKRIKMFQFFGWAAE